MRKHSAHWQGLPNSWILLWCRLLKTESEVLGRRWSTSHKGLTPRRQHLFQQQQKIKHMAVAQSIFTLGGWVQLFWAAFDMTVTGVPLKVALGYKKIVYWVFQKNNHDVTLRLHFPDYFFEIPKNQICPILMILLMEPLSQAYQKLPKTIETPYLKWILGQLGLFS